MAMDQFLAEYYGTNKTASATQEDLEKQASVELFLKLAKEENIDISKLPDAKVEELYTSWAAKVAEAASMGTSAWSAAKTASEEKEEEEKKKHEEAKKEHEEKKAAAEKVAEADFLGRVMAHSMVQEMRKIAADTKVAELPPALMAHMKGKEDGKDGKDDEKHEEKKDEHKHEEKKDEDKKASAIDALALKRAGEIVKEAGLDPEVALKKIAAAYTLNLVKESTKVASAPDVTTAVEVRALELLEGVGYPVEWSK